MTLNAIRKALLIGLGTLLCALSEPPPAKTTLDPDGSAVVQELEVYGRYPGPALWKVKKGEGEVTILGSLAPLPHMLEWKSPRLERALDAAQVVLAPPTGRVGILDALNVMFHGGDARLPGGRLLWDEITPDERARFENLLGQIGGKPDRYLHLKPAIAGFLLLSDFRRGAGLAEAKPVSTVEALAKTRHVRVRTFGRVKLPMLFHAVTHMDAAGEKACFDAAITQAEHDASQARPLAQAWADGDLKAVRAGYRPSVLERYVSEFPTLQAAIDQGEDEAVKAIDELLNSGGKAVAVVDLTLLQGRNGVLDRLKTEGAEITVPRE